MIYGILLIIGGLLAVPSLLLSKKPDAQKYFDQFAPYQGWLGVLFTFWGVWAIIQCIIHVDLIAHFPINWIIWLLVALVQAGLGFILGYGLIQKYALSKNEAAAEKGEQILKKLMPLQGTIGIAAIILGVIDIVVRLIWVVG